MARRNIAYTEGMGGRMISKLTISRFKSIKHLSLDCKRINIFIGEPNTGKSNILETIGLLSFLFYSQPRFAQSDVKQFVRFERVSNLFYDENLDQALELKCDTLRLQLQFKDGSFVGISEYGGQPQVRFGGDHSNMRIWEFISTEKLAPFKYYRFRIHENFPSELSDFLIPPSGANLLSLLLAKKELRAIVNQPFSNMGLRLGLRPQEKKLEVVKQIDDVIISYPYSLTSETLQRITFYLSAILTNKDSVLAFEEPESHAFPYYTKYLAEQIALDRQNNQYFITTHNPYFLLPILEKADKSEVAVHITYFEDYQTKVKALSEKELAELGEIDVFSNIERYLKA